MLTYSEAAEKLGCGKRTLQRYVSKGKIPSEAMYRLPAKLYFIEAELENIMNGGGIK